MWFYGVAFTTTVSSVTSTSQFRIELVKAATPWNGAGFFTIFLKTSHYFASIDPKLLVVTVIWAVPQNLE